MDVQRPAGTNPIMRAASLLAATALALSACAAGSSTGQASNSAGTPAGTASSSALASPSGTASLSSVAPAPMPVADARGYLLVERDDFSAGEPGARTFSVINVTTGEESQLGRGVQAAFSKDGSRVHLVRQDETCVPTLITTDLTGAQLDSIDTGLKALDLGFAWAPDDRTIVFTRFDHGPPNKMCGSQGGTWSEEELAEHLMVMRESDGWKPTPLLAVQNIPGPRWSPDGGAVVAGSRLVDVASGVTVDLGAIAAHLGALPDPNTWSWSPEGRYLAFEYPSDERHMVGVIDVDGRSARSVGEFGNAWNVPAWSPDGNAIAVVRGMNGGTLTLLDARGAAAERSLGEPVVNEFSPFGWSPDNAWIAWHALDGSLHVISVDASTAHLVLPTDDVHRTAFVAWAMPGGSGS